MLAPLQEHERLFNEEGQPVGFDERFKNLELIQWCKPTEDSPWGYYASFKIGAEWMERDKPLVVTAKRGMENIDFLRMFMTCFTSDLAVDSFAEIYKIDLDKPAIKAPGLNSIVSPLIVLHFLGVVNRIKSLKKGYVHRQENLKKVKGHIKLLKNERTNIASKRYDRIYCEYDEYSVDIPENRILKKALQFSLGLINSMSSNQTAYPEVKRLILRNLAKFDNVGDDVSIYSIGQTHSSKLFREYAEAIRLAKIILRHFDYSITKVGEHEDKVPPFVLDMSLLYEHYVYGLLYEAYHEKISYQFSGETGFPDFLYRSRDFKAILDTKYIPKYEKTKLDTYVVRQLSGYSRDLSVLKYLGYKDIDEEAPTPPVPCVIIYPTEGQRIFNPFKDKALQEICTQKVKNLSMFYKLDVPVPTIKR
jgi:5-methylcytosine-specific restriction enzyme subunit McrC